MTINKKEDIYIELALFVNRLMFDNNYIKYELYRDINDILLKRGLF